MRQETGGHLVPLRIVPIWIFNIVARSPLHRCHSKPLAQEEGGRCRGALKVTISGNAGGCGTEEKYKNLSIRVGGVVVGRPQYAAMCGDTYGSNLVYPNTTLYYSSGRGERIHEQYPDPALFGASHSHSNSHLMTGVSSFDPRGIVTFDLPTQHPPYFGQSFTGTLYPGIAEAGYPFPISQQVPVQATFQPAGSHASAPSGGALPPGHSHAPPVHLGCSPAPSTCLPAPYNPRGAIFSVPPRGVDIQPQPVSVSIVGSVGHVQPSHSTTSMFRQNRTSAPPRKTPSHPSKPKPLVHCPVCGVPSKRRQERDRHLLSHLPCWIACSIGPCLWRGDRFDMFTKHLYDKHHTTGPDGHWRQLYNPRPFVDGLVKYSISIEYAKQLAIAKVKATALVIGKQEFSEDPWGRKGKDSQ
ncbi:hypothetical protein EDB89DRAFT_1997080 [Lactarius sanguifluus]|nr:hypothetical protein EDB89DRAFT_2018057 [Lactarius sanguifluus]KAH9167521.1 hypothetical protein EDB89DRAFT_1997080 [Lactarius sanguifluus]